MRLFLCHLNVGRINVNGIERLRKPNCGAERERMIEVAETETREIEF
jgi:hypothetical protein